MSRYKDIDMMIEESCTITKVNRLYDIISEGYNDNTLSQEEYNDAVDNLNYILEKKTKADYRLEKFKKRHDYDPQTKTIKGNDGERVNFRYIKSSYKRDEPIFGHIRTSTNTVTMNTRAFNSKHPKTNEFVLQHELGHKHDKLLRQKAATIYEKLRYLAKDYFEEKDKPNPDQTKLEKILREGDKYEDELNELKVSLNELDSDVRKFLSEYKNMSPHGKRNREYYADYYAHSRVGNKVSKNSTKDMKDFIQGVDDIKLFKLKFTSLSKEEQDKFNSMNGGEKAKYIKDWANKYRKQMLVEHKARKDSIENLKNNKNANKLYGKNK